jgi:arylsulfatase A-like enzyme
MALCLEGSGRKPLQTRSPLRNATRRIHGMSSFRFLLLIVAVPSLGAPAVAAEREKDRPNVVVLLADDMGYNAPACYGSDLHETPAIDRLAEEGVKFTDAYAACTVCSPTRASVMTGKYPARLNVTNWIAGHDWANPPLRDPDWTKRLERSQTTVAEALRAAGYRTAHLGKWHLTPPNRAVDNVTDFYPTVHGFEINVGGGQWGSPPGGYFLPNRLDLPRGEEGEYLTDRLTDRCLRIIERWKDEPFFIYFPYYTIHTPIQAPEELVRHYREKLEAMDGDPLHENPTYAGMVHAQDRSVGRILEKLDELGLAEDTMVIFSSDNGGLSRRFGEPTGFTDNAPMRRGKGAAYEGGVRVPTVVRYPGVTPEGEVCEEPIASIDFYPTILEAVGVAGDEAHNGSVDGVSLLPVLRDPEASLDREALYWHYPHYHPGGLPEGPYSAVRRGDWKLVVNGAGPKVDADVEADPVHLSNLAADPGERENLADERPDLADELETAVRAWHGESGAGV